MLKFVPLIFLGPLIFCSENFWDTRPSNVLAQVSKTTFANAPKLADAVSALQTPQ